MTRMRTLLIPVLVGGALLVSAPPAQAAPGDCLILAGQPVCEPYPTDPNAPFPVYSICTPLEPAGNIIRKSCQDYLTATDEPIGDPQIFNYGTENTLTPPVIPSYTPPPAYVTPTESPVTTRPAPTRAPASTRTVVVTEAPETVRETVEVAAPTTTPATTSAAPTTDAAAAPDWPGLTSDDDRENWFMSVSDGALLGIAAVAALVLLLAVVVPPAWRRRQAGAHRAP